MSDVIYRPLREPDEEETEAMLEMLNGDDPFLVWGRIDYEAAVKALHGKARSGVEAVDTIRRQAVKAAVDAALGIGGNDEL